MAKKKKENSTVMHSSETYYFVDSDGTEGCSNVKPYRHAMGFWITEEPINIIELPKGTIYRLYGINLSFDDEPITEKIER